MCNRVAEVGSLTADAKMAKKIPSAAYLLFLRKMRRFLRASPNFSADTVRASASPGYVFLTQLELVMVVMVVTKGMSETLSVCGIVCCCYLRDFFVTPSQIIFLFFIGSLYR